LNEGTDFKDCGADHQSQSSANFFCERKDHKGSKEATALEAGHDVGRVEVDGRGTLSSEAEFIFEGSKSNCATNKTLIR